MDLALSSESGVEVPLAPGGNLVLSECVFCDNDFAAPWAARARAAESAGRGSRGLAGAAGVGAGSGLRAAVVKEIASAESQTAFSAFMHGLEQDLAPRMRQALVVWQNRKADDNLES